MHKYYKEINELMIKINVQKDKYSQLIVNEETPSQRKHREECAKRKLTTIYIIIVGAILLVGLAICYSILKAYKQQKYLWIYLLVAFLILLTMYIVSLYQYYLINKYKNEIVQEQLTLKEEKYAIIGLNKQLPTLILSIICINDHYYELAHLTQKAQKKRFKELIEEYIWALNVENDYNSTIEEYINLYNFWKEFHNID